MGGKWHHQGSLASCVPFPGFLVQSCPDPAVYGVVQSGDHVGRTCMVKWFKLRPSGDDVEVSVCSPHVFLQGCLQWVGYGAPGLMTTHPVPQLIGEEEDVSVYDIADHPDFRFRTTDIVIRIGNTEDGGPHKEDEVHPSKLKFHWLLPIPCSSCSPWWCHQVALGDKTCKFSPRPSLELLPQQSPQWS